MRSVLFAEPAIWLDHRWLRWRTMKSNFHLHIPIAIDSKKMHFASNMNIFTGYKIKHRQNATIFPMRCTMQTDFSICCKQKKRKRKTLARTKFYTEKNDAFVCLDRLNKLRQNSIMKNRIQKYFRNGCDDPNRFSFSVCVWYAAYSNYVYCWWSVARSGSAHTCNRNTIFVICCVHSPLHSARWLDARQERWTHTHTHTLTRTLARTRSGRLLWKTKKTRTNEENTNHSKNA